MEVVLNNILKIICMYNIVFSSIISSTNKTDRHDIDSWNIVDSGVKHHKPTKQSHQSYK